VWEPGATVTGGRSTTRLVAALPARAFWAVNVTVNGPAALPEGGVQLNVPLLCAALVVNDAPAGMPAAESEAMPSRSGSLAVTVKVSGAFSVAARVAGAVTIGERSAVRRVVAAPLSAFRAVNVTG